MTGDRWRAPGAKGRLRPPLFLGQSPQEPEVFRHPRGRGDDGGALLDSRFRYQHFELRHARSTVRARAELLADMMDAVHNIPQLLLSRGEVDETLLRGMLSGFDQKWSSEGVSLGATFDDALRPAG